MAGGINGRVPFREGKWKSGNIGPLSYMRMLGIKVLRNTSNRGGLIGIHLSMRLRL